MTKEQEEIVLRNIGLIYMVIRVHEYDEEECLDLGYIGLCKGAKKYRKELGLTESTFLVPCIENEIKGYFVHLYSKGSNERTIPLDTVLNEDKNLKVIDIISTDENILKYVIQKEQLDVLHDVLVDCSERDRNIICKRYGFLKTNTVKVEEIIREYEISRQSIYNIIMRFICEVKKRYWGTE